ncbi:MAG: ABC transporter permease [Chloroflexota bacterium]
MGRYLFFRLLQTILAMFGMAVLVFLLVRASGDPTDLMRNSAMTEQDIQNIRHSLGLDKPYPQQFVIYMGDLMTGNLGRSLVQRRPVADMLGAALPNTVKLAGLGFAASVVASVVLGVLAAIKRDGILDNGVKFIAILGQALPTFFLGILAILVFSVHWELFPAAGLGGWQHYVLPVGTLAFFILPGLLRLVRSSMLDVLDSEYIKLARIKGVPERVVIWKHALRNAIIAPLTAAGVVLSTLIVGIVVLEVVFAWPGVGTVLVTAVSGRDFPVVQDITLLVAALVLAINLLVDIAYAYIDPRIRY